MRSNHMKRVMHARRQKPSTAVATAFRETVNACERPEPDTTDVSGSNRDSTSHEPVSVTPKIFLSSTSQSFTVTVFGTPLHHPLMFNYIHTSQRCRQAVGIQHIHRCVSCHTNVVGACQASLVQRVFNVSPKLSGCRCNRNCES